MFCNVTLIYFRDLISLLLERDRRFRLGSGLTGAGEVRGHLWFQGVDWGQVLAKRMKPPIIPSCKGEGDTLNFIQFSEVELSEVPRISHKDEKLFKDF